MKSYPLQNLSAAITGFACAAAALHGLPAKAESSPAFFRAELMVPLAQPQQEVVDGVIWRCEAAVCTGTRSGSRPVIVCGRMAQKFGAVRRFIHAGGELDAKALARCNGE